MNELEEILSGAGEAMPEIEQAQPEATTQPRDEAGRFANQQEEVAAVEADPAESVPVEQHQPSGVPVKAVQEEREKRQAAQAKSESLERELAELRGQMQAFAMQQRPQQTAQEQQKPAGLFDDPESFLRSHITPVQQQMADMREFMSENLAVQQYGEETVSAAKQAIEQAARTQEGHAVIQRAMSSRHPYGEIVKWHRQQQVMARIGNDPDAFVQAELERRLSDPAEQAKILERLRGSAAANTSRSQPVTQLPPSLSRLPAGGNAAADNDASDAALFSHATR